MILQVQLVIISNSTVTIVHGYTCTYSSFTHLSHLLMLACDCTGNGYIVTECSICINRGNFSGPTPYNDIISELTKYMSIN